MCTKIITKSITNQPRSGACKSCQKGHCCGSCWCCYAPWPTAAPGWYGQPVKIEPTCMMCPDSSPRRATHLAGDWEVCAGHYNAIAEPWAGEMVEAY